MSRAVLEPGISRFNVFEDCEAADLTTQPTWPDCNMKIIYLIKNRAVPLSGLKLNLLLSFNLNLPGKNGPLEC